MITELLNRIKCRYSENLYLFVSQCVKIEPDERLDFVDLEQIIPLKESQINKLDGKLRLRSSIPIEREEFMELYCNSLP